MDNKYLSKIQLAENFSLDEFVNESDGYACILDNRLIEAMQKLRNVVGSIQVTSGYRTPEYNKKVGGVEDSYHLTGQAADCRFDFTGWTEKSMSKLFESCGFSNAGFYTIDGKPGSKLNRVHLDVGPCRNGAKFLVFHKKA